MEAKYKNFGDFLHQKRLEKKMSYRDLANLLGVTAPYISDIEKGRRNAPSLEKLHVLSAQFSLSKEEETLMFDLAGEKKDSIAPDIPGYIKDRDYVVSALRTARDLDASEKDWQDFVDDLKRRKG